MQLQHSLPVAALLTLAACGADEGSQTQDALDGLSSAYERLAGSITSESGDAIDWAREDVENLGDWEYRIVDLAMGSPGDIEAELNRLGDERWEAWWIEETPAGPRIYLKRTAFSLVSRVPLTALIRTLAGGDAP